MATGINVVKWAVSAGELEAAMNGGGAVGVRIKLNPAGIRAVLKDPGVQAYLRSKAEAVQSAAGPGHSVIVGVGANRAAAYVMTETYLAKLAEARNRALTRAVDAARG